MEPVFIRLHEVQKVLGVGRTKVFELIANGELESVTIGRCRLVPADAVHAYADRIRKTSAA